MAAIDFIVGRLLTRASARARSESGRASELLAALAGKRIAIHVVGTPWAAAPMCIESDGVALMLGTAAAAAVPLTPDTTPRADAILTGAPLSLLALAGADSQAPIRRGDVRIEGDAQVAQHYRELAALLVPDLEHGLAQIMGRGAAHVAARGLQGASELARNAAWNTVQNLAEFLAHESGDLVSRHEAEQFLRGTEQLRERLDRLDAHLADLERRAEAVDTAAGPN